MRRRKGRVVYKGATVTDVNTDVGYMTQKDNLLPWRNVRDNVAFPLELAGVGKDRARGARRRSDRSMSGSTASRTATRTNCPAACASARASPA